MWVFVNPRVIRDGADWHNSLVLAPSAGAGESVWVLYRSI
jgi:hypothetical protein